GTNVSNAEHIDEVIRKFMSALGQVYCSFMPCRIVMKEFRILQLHHRRARAGRADHNLLIFKNPDHVLRQRPGIVMKTAIKMWLAAARLPLRKINSHSQTAEKPDGRYPDFRKKCIA